MLRVAPLEPFPGQAFEPRLGIFAVGRDLVGVFVGQFLEAEIAAACQFSRVGDRLRIVCEQPCHFARTFQMPLGVAIEAEACLVDGAGLADAGENVLQAAARRVVAEHVVGRDERNARGFGDGGKTMEPFRIVSMKAIGGGEIDTAFELSCQILQMLLEIFGFCRCLERIVRRRHCNDLPFRKGQEIFKPKVALAFGDLGFVIAMVAMVLVVMAGLVPAFQF